MNNFSFFFNKKKPIASPLKSIRQHLVRVHNALGVYNALDLPIRRKIPKEKSIEFFSRFFFIKKKHCETTTEHRAAPYKGS